jgi:squalene cyclase
MQFNLKITSALTLIFLLGCRSHTSALRDQCSNAEKKGIDFLAASQQDGGAFITYEWRTLYPDRKRTIDTPFTVSQVLYSLTFCADNSIARGVREPAAAYLVRQREGPGVWRYQGRTDRVPPDVDDTSLAWAALKRDGKSIASDALNAVRASRNADGLFNTWIGDPSTWTHIDTRDIDAVVNLNALLFFGLAHENFDAVCTYLLSQVENDGFRRGSIYYPSPLAFTFALSRAYADGGVDCLKKVVPKIRGATLALQEKDGGWGTDYETALGLLTLLNLGERGAPLDRAITLLVSRQMSDGGWALSTVYTGANTWVGGRYIYGSRDFTTALCVEALAKYLRQ